MFHYVIEQQGSKTVTSFEGDMDIEVTELMEDEMLPKLLESKEIEIDFAKVHFVDSSGIGLLISLINSLREQGSQVVIKKINPEVMQVFSLLQLPEILGRDVFDGLEQQ